MKEIEVQENPILTAEVLRIRKSLQQSGYALTNDAALGMPPDMHLHIANWFYRDGLLGPEVPGVLPADRLRSRDVVEYRREPACLLLNEHHTIAMRAVINATRPREYKRTYTLEIPQFITWINTYLSMVPPDEQQTHGTLGLNFVRTFRDLVAHKHQDQEQFVCIYVVARQTEGAVTSLYPIKEPEKTLLAVALQPGEYLIFRDCDFMHDASRLQPRFEGDSQYRDAIVALVHYPEHSNPTT